jgi:hypothetical protein
VGYGRDTHEAACYASSGREEMRRLHDIFPLPFALNGERRRETR